MKIITEWPKTRNLCPTRRWNIFRGTECHRLLKERQWPYSGVYSMKEKLAQPGKGRGCTTPAPFHYVHHHVTITVYAKAERATLPLYEYSVFKENRIHSSAIPAILHKLWGGGEDGGVGRE